MHTRRAGLAALAAAAGIWLCFSGPAQALTAAAKPSAQAAAAKAPIVLAKFSKRHAQSAKTLRQAQSQQARKTSGKRFATRSDRRHAAKYNRRYAAKSGRKSEARFVPNDALPPTVADARAEALTKDQEKNIAALDSTDVSMMDGVQIAASDQLNDVDRSLSEADAVVVDPAPAAAPLAAPPPAVQSVKKIPPVSTATVVRAEGSDTWSNTSLIGKMFVALGSLLTLASAARLMFA